MSDEQQTYLAAPNHHIKDIMHIHSLGYAIPGDGDRWTKETKWAETDA